MMCPRCLIISGAHAYPCLQMNAWARPAGQQEMARRLRKETRKTGRLFIAQPPTTTKYVAYGPLGEELYEPT